MDKNFAWKNLPEEVTRSLARQYRGHGLSENHGRPDINFVCATIDILTEQWVPTLSDEECKKIVGELVSFGIGPSNRVPNTKKTRVHFIQASGSTKNVRKVLLDALLRAGATDSVDSQSESLPSLAILVPAEQQPEEVIEAFPYQEVAWQEMTGRYARSKESGVYNGLLVMPTGSGKTFTAARWLIEHVVNEGGKVLWIAHRRELLEQAASTFDRFAYLAKKRPQIQRRLVSGAHLTAKSIDPDNDDIIVCSVQSLARDSRIFQDIASRKNFFLVVDEAHHAPATISTGYGSDLRLRVDSSQGARTRRQSLGQDPLSHWAVGWTTHNTQPNGRCCRGDQTSSW